MLARQVEVCLVVNELYPLNKGGIGRWLFNLLTADAGDASVSYTILLYGGNFHNVDRSLRDAVADVYSDIAEIVYLEDVVEELAEDVRVQIHDSFDEFAVESYLLYSGLKEICSRRGRGFNFIEFLDYGGPAFFTAQARKGEDWLKETTVSVRLHSTNSLIVEHERFNTAYSSWHAKLHDIERKALLDADLIVAHVQAIADVNCEYYAFPSEWRSKVVLSIPPILLDVEDNDGAGDEESSVPVRPTFAFTARLAPFKQPHLFIAAAKQLLDQGSNALFLLASYGWDHNYVQRLKSMVPARHADSIVFMSDLPEKQRLDAIRNAIIVIPSNYESFCFLAYESLLRRQKVILNETCLAFGANPFWRDRDNCLFFDGTAASLADAMLRATVWQPTSFEVPPPNQHYWKEEGKRLTHSETTATAPASYELTIIAHGPSIANKVLSPYVDSSEVNIISIEDGWYDGERIREFVVGDGFVVFTTPNVILGAEYLRYAVSLLEKSPEFSGVVPQFVDFSGRFAFGLRGGDLISSAVSDVGKIGVMGAVLRKSLFRDSFLWQETGEHWLHTGICRSILRGARYAVCAIDPCKVFGVSPDPFLNKELSVGITKSLVREYTEKFNALIVDAVYHSKVDEGHLYRELRGQLHSAEAMARERLGAIYEMERMIVERDKHIAADAIMLQERLDAIHAMDKRISELERQRR